MMGVTSLGYDVLLGGGFFVQGGKIVSSNLMAVCAIILNFGIFPGSGIWIPAFLK